MVDVRRWAGMAVHGRSADALRFAARLAGGPRTVRGAAAATLAAVPRGWRDDDQAVFDAVVAAWPECFPGPTAPAALVVDRSAARTMFFFTHGPAPVVVAKVPRDAGRIEREEAALTRAAPAAMAPVPLGWAAGAFVQKGLAGSPPVVGGVAAPDVPHMAAPPALGGLDRALARLAEATATPGPPEELAGVADALDAASLPGAAAARDVAAVDTSVLRHGDLSPQNWLVDGGVLTGVVDWEMAVASGMPGFDALHAAVTWFELAVVAGGGDEEAVAAGFDMAWASAPLFEEARRSATAGVPDRLSDAVVVAFFARRLVRRLQRAGGTGRDARIARRMLDVVARG